MAKTKRRFGKKNIIKVDPLAYNIGLIGESGIGKSTLIKEVCEKLVGEDGYMIFNTGKEDGVSAIANAIYEDVPDWATFNEITNDIIENKNEHYTNLRVIIYDTLDQLIEITEPEVVRLHNKDNPQKRVKTINSAFGGFGKGQDKVIELILDRIWQLKKIGVGMILVGHTKTRTLNDPITGADYDMLTTNMPHKYFNAFKTKLHFLGVASVDRRIETTTTTSIMGHTEKTGKVTGMARTITFRDDNFNIDSKSRFSEIVSSIPLDADEFIKALTDAIEKEHNKQSSVKSIEETRVLQDKEFAQQTKEEIKKINSINVEKNNELIEVIKSNVSNIDTNVLQEVMKKYNLKDFANPEIIETIALEEIVSLIK